MIQLTSKTLKRFSCSLQTVNLAVTGKVICGLFLSVLISDRSLQPAFQGKLKHSCCTVNHGVKSAASREEQEGPIIALPSIALAFPTGVSPLGSLVTHALRAVDLGPKGTAGQRVAQACCWELEKMSQQ